MAKSAVAHIGTSGYQYDHWKSLFYPADLPQERWFRFYTERFETVEINNTFYHLPEIKSFEEWRDQSSADFRFSLKYSRYGSHMKRLKDPREALDKFTRRAETLDGKLGPVLVQLPPHWKVNPERLEGFFRVANRDYRWAFEMRDPSWLCDEVYGILARYNAALCIHDMIEDHPRPLTADWVYLRYHGRYDQGRYDTPWLTAEARRIKELLGGGREVWAYFNNDQGGYAVENATELRRLLGQIR